MNTFLGEALKTTIHLKTFIPFLNMAIMSEQMSYQVQLQHKTQFLKSLFADIKIPDLEVFSSIEDHFRMRAEFRIWHEGNDCFYAMFTPGQKPTSQSLIKISTFPTAHQHITDLMPVLIRAISQNEILKQKLYQVEFLSTLAGETLVTLIYHKKLDEHWQFQASQLAENLAIQIMGRSKGQKLILNHDYVVEKLVVNNKTWLYKQVEASFTQPNAVVCQKMLTWTSDIVKTLNRSYDLLELYCGNGNFTLPLSLYFNQVLATELSKTSVAAAHWNIEKNQINNIKIARLSAEEFTEAFQGKREFKRLKEQQIDLKHYHFSTVFVDPPRAGIDTNTLILLSQFENILYISCNPQTLHENMLELAKTHIIKKMALFDQFPFTPHIESGVWLQKKH